MAAQLGGKVESGHHREFGRAEVDIVSPSALFEGVWRKGERHTVWMSHGDRVTRLPPGFSQAAVSRELALCGAHRREAALFRPDVSPRGGAYARRGEAHLEFRAQDRRLRRAIGPWRPIARRRSARSARRPATGRVLCGLSGGVDSAVAAVLIHEAVGDRLTCVFVDHGLMREGEAKEVVELFRGHYNIPLVHVDAADMFLAALAGVADPEQKRKTIGRLFIEVFEKEAKRIAADGKGAPEFLAQGTLYPDVIESVSATRRPVGHHQEPSQCRRASRAHAHEARRAFARALQGRGARARARARPPRSLRRPPPLPGAGPRHPLPGAGDEGSARHAPQGRRDLSRRDPPRRPLRRHLAGLRGALARCAASA